MKTRKRSLGIITFLSLWAPCSAVHSQENVSPTAAAFPVEKLPAGYVRGDVVSYSYVPNRYWGRAEAMGVLPYLFEYGMMKWSGDPHLEAYHEENIRRIDMVSKWSTCIQLYNREAAWRDEIINLMIRCFKNRQLIILSARPNEDKPNKCSFRNLIGILEKLWEDRDKTLTSPEGDQATGRQLINNILMVNMGDENLQGIKTDGMTALFDRFKREIRDRLFDGQRPFAHIKTWYNEIQYGLGCYAANEDELNTRKPRQGRQKWPVNSEFIGVDAYHYWMIEKSPLDPDDPNIPRQKIIDQAVHWQNVMTQYHGPDFRVKAGKGWRPEHSNDTHAMLQAIDLAGADHAMMLYLGCSQNPKRKYFTTPIETMDAYYDSLKAGPWIGLGWWIFDAGGRESSTLDYLDKTLKHYTADHPEGLDYTEDQLESYRTRFIASRMRMFNDVVYNQFGYLNGPQPSE